MERRTMKPARPQTTEPLPTDPSPDEIRAWCELQQSTWTDAEKAKRAGAMPSGRRRDDAGVEITVIRMGDLA